MSLVVNLIGQRNRDVIGRLSESRDVINGLHVTSWRPCWCTGTIRFFSSGS